MVILQEGHYYPFKVLGKVADVNGAEYYKLSDPNGIKHLLKAEWYAGYELEAGRTVVCHINRINCSGRIFIEPEHPVYKPGKDYVFEIAAMPGRNEDTVVVKDVLGNLIELPAEDVPPGAKNGDGIKCRVTTVKKGKPVIYPLWSAPDYTGLTIGNTYRLRVTNKRKRTGGQVFYMLEDDRGKSYPLRKKFYERYGFGSGDTISCVLKQKSDAIYFEPVHPYYRKGERFTFKIAGNDHIFVYPDRLEEAVILQNDFGKNVIVSRKAINPENISGDTIVCLVSDIVEGQLILDCK